MLGRVYLIAVLTYRQSVRQPLFYIILFASAALLFIAAPFTLFGFGEEITMLREIGLATITFAGFMVAILSADLTIATEIDKQTTLVTFSKPIRRAEFVFGKFIGIGWSLFLATVFLGIIFLMVYWLKEGRDQINANLMEGVYLKKGAMAIFIDTLNFFIKDGAILVAGIYISFLQVLILCAVAVGFATFFTLPLTASGCLVFFLLGHISHYLHNSLIKINFFPLRVIAQILYLILPNLTNLNISGLVASLSPISIGYLFISTLYTTIYSVIILLITSLIFSKREL